jgi:hypothetical protein
VNESFPQPSKRYDGVLLDPLLVEEDFTSAVGILRRYARRRPGFTDDEILAHLAANGVVLYGPQKDWDDLFAEMRDTIELDGMEQGTEISWAIRQGENPRYTLLEGLPAAASAEPSAEAGQNSAVDQVALLAELDAYMQVTAFVMGSLTALKHLSIGLSFAKLWKRAKFGEDISFEEFKHFIRKMEKDGLVTIVRDAKVSTRSAKRDIRASKVLVANITVRGSWRMNARENLKARYEKALEELINTVQLWFTGRRYGQGLPALVGRCKSAAVLRKAHQEASQAAAEQAGQESREG